MLRLSGYRAFGSDTKERFIKSIAQQNLLPHHPRISSLPSDMSVLIPLIICGSLPSILFTKRSVKLKSHRGEVCFPGGKREEGETMEQPLLTALRETEEEIGLPSNTVEVWGRLKPVLTRHLTSTITPVVGLIRDEKTLLTSVVNCHEVQTVFSAPLDEICRSVRYTRFNTGKLQYKLPIFRTKNFKIHYHSKDAFLASEFRIWGLSAVMLHQALLHIASENYGDTLDVMFY